ncbi:MAG: 30S ribosomal protein S20 [Candidatus Yanofskybacteria bacterium RIFCSPHIGHO2_02_FULL_41_11]|uniref:Small ribosomal subunit protein bS20 n=1 Tax=Candidatus Yanofskybacteria bacterium RIFCSPHIGHO2_02_FULL_41_11 TaxID=1802675 RepID=A0A1F8FAG3_9BACT|nr:MAG: 30S ribosomal protein S20 [Candidatus Yanofskybacteria bacterium RIFCSPHIGHO2_02_FULL_41_11]
MPITQSAKKALKQSKKRRFQNLRQTRAYRESVKEFKKLIKAGDFNSAKKLLPKVYKTLDKAAKTGVIKKNKASRLKSRTSVLLATK